MTVAVSLVGGNLLLDLRWGLHADVVKDVLFQLIPDRKLVAFSPPFSVAARLSAALIA